MENVSKSKLKHGMKVTCTIDGDDVSDAKISIDNGIIYICQNSEDGEITGNLLGYKYSWTIGTVSDNDYFLVTNLKIKDGFSVSDIPNCAYVVRKGDNRNCLVFKNTIDGEDTITYIKNGKVDGWDYISQLHISDIKAIYKPTHALFMRHLDEPKVGTIHWSLVWKKEVVIEEITMEQLCKELGREVKIKK